MSDKTFLDDSFTRTNLIDPGKYDGRIIGVIELGSHTSEFKNKTGKGVNISEARSILFLIELVDLYNEDQDFPRLTRYIVNVTNSKRGKFLPFLIELGLLPPNAFDDLEETKETINGLFKNTKSVEKAFIDKQLSVTLTVNTSEKGNQYNAISKLSSVDERIELTKSRAKKSVFLFHEPNFEVFTQILTAFTRKDITNANNVADLPPEYLEYVITEESENSSNKASKEENKQLLENAKGVL